MNVRPPESPSRLLHLWRIFAVHLILFPCGLNAQNLTPTDQPSDPTVSIIQKTISAMGGEGWIKVGGSTVQSTIIYFNGGSIEAIRSDDWSDRGLNRHRLDMGKSRATRTLIDSSGKRIASSNSKLEKIAPADYDLVALAEVNPAMALRIAQSRRCRFEVITQQTASSSEKIGALNMDCLAPTYPHQIAHFIWWFDPSGRPSQVEVPVLSMDGRFELSRLLQYERFQQVGELTVPVEIKTFIDGHLVKTESVSNVAFQTSLSKTTFDLPAQQ